MYMWSEEKFSAIVAILRHNWVQCATGEKFLKWLEIPWFLGCKQFLFQLESVSRPFSKTKIDFSTDCRDVFLCGASLRWWKLQSRNFIKLLEGVTYTDLKGIFQQRPNVSISPKKKLQKKNGQVLQWDHFQSLWLLGLCFFGGWHFGLFGECVFFVYHLFAGVFTWNFGEDPSHLE